MFTEDDSDDEILTTPPSKGGYGHVGFGHDDDDDDDERRQRSQSSGSEQIGRFEVRLINRCKHCTGTNKYLLIQVTSYLQHAKVCVGPSMHQLCSDPYTQLHQL